MIIRVNREICDGCGVCAEACSVEAIQLVEQQAVIDEELCTQCEACIAACPNGSIAALPIPVSSTSIVALPVVESRMIPALTQKTLPETATPTRGLAPLAGAALAFLGREVAPRLADVLITALERRFAHPLSTAIAPASPPSRSQTARDKGERKQARFRGGRAGNRNHRERR